MQKMTSMEKLFPLPSRPTVCWDQTPHSLPGATPDSNVKLAELMRLSDERYHTFFNKQGFHKYALVLRLLAASIGRASC